MKQVNLQIKTAENLIHELEERNLIANITNKTKLINALAKGWGIYIGFDPTAPSLHLGNYVGIKILKHFHNCGFKAVAVLGGATGLIGDPSFKKGERKLLELKQVVDNSNIIQKQLLKYSNCDQVINNLNFYQKMNVIDFLRNVGKHINVNYLLDKEALKTRLQTGLSYTEFTYPLLQSWDFLNLFQNHKIAVQAGGSDQWGNITTGIEMIRKVLGEDANVAGFTFQLLTDYLGNKFGKSENNALFLNAEITHPYVIYQFLLNSADEDVCKYLLSLTFLQICEIKKIVAIHNDNLSLRYGQKKLAKELITEVFGIKTYEFCEKLTMKLFNNKVNDLTKDDYEALTKVLPTIIVNKKTSLLQALVSLKLTDSLSNARKLIQAQGVSINNVKLNDVNAELSFSSSNFSYLLLKKGKKQFGLIHFGK